MRLFSALLSLSALILASAPDSLGCTSAIVGSTLSANGTTMLWKHRDSLATHSFVARTEATDSTLAYIALHNAGDSLLAEAWTGVNSSGFAIMNTASYNLTEPDADCADREGRVMAQALATCRSVDDFERLLADYPSPLGVEANFGVIDASGNGAYFETDNTGYRRFNLYDEGSDGLLIRTNFSLSGDPAKGYGYTRHENAKALLSDAERPFSPATFLQTLSCSFFNSMTGHDPYAEGDAWAVDQDFIPRSSTSASVVIETGAPNGAPQMWIVLGYPPTGIVRRATLDDIPAQLLPNERWSSPDADAAWERRKAVFPATRDNGQPYVNLEAIRAFKHGQSPK